MHAGSSGALPDSTSPGLSSDAWLPCVTSISGMPDVRPREPPPASLDILRKEPPLLRWGGKPGFGFSNPRELEPTAEALVLEDSEVLWECGRGGKPSGTECSDGCVLLEDA